MKRLFSILALCAPLFASAGELTITCIGPESSNCPVNVDVTLRTERLTTEFLVRTTTGGYAATALGWCGPDGGGRGEWRNDKGCVTSGKFRVVNGELTKQQLADGSIQFEIHKPMAFCGNSSGYAQCSIINF